MPGLKGIFSRFLNVQKMSLRLKGKISSVYLCKSRDLDWESSPVSVSFLDPIRRPDRCLAFFVFRVRRGPRRQQQRRRLEPAVVNCNPQWGDALDGCNERGRTSQAEGPKTANSSKPIRWSNHIINSSAPSLGHWICGVSLVKDFPKASRGPGPTHIATPVSESEFTLHAGQTNINISVKLTKEIMTKQQQISCHQCASPIEKQAFTSAPPRLS